MMTLGRFAPAGALAAILGVVAAPAWCARISKNSNRQEPRIGIKKV
jgi:hypothetical protein